MGFLGKLRWEKQKVKQRAHYEEERKRANMDTWNRCFSHCRLCGAAGAAAA